MADLIQKQILKDQKVSARSQSRLIQSQSDDMPKVYKPHSQQFEDEERDFLSLSMQINKEHDERIRKEREHLRNPVNFHL